MNICGTKNKLLYDDKVIRHKRLVDINERIHQRAYTLMELYVELYNLHVNYTYELEFLVWSDAGQEFRSILIKNIGRESYKQIYSIVLSYSRGRAIRINPGTVWS